MHSSVSCCSRKSPSLSLRISWWTSRVGLMRLSTQCLPVGCCQQISRYSLKSWNVFGPVARNLLRSVVETIRKACITLTQALPLRIPERPPNAEVIRFSIPDPSMSFPMQPQNDCTVCIIPGLRMTVLNLWMSFHLIWQATIYSWISTDICTYVIPMSLEDFLRYSIDVSTVSGWEALASIRGPNM